MKKLFFSLALIGLILSGCDNQRAHYLRVFRSIHIQVKQNSQALHNLTQMCNHYGPRLAGTTGANQAEELCAMLLRSYGIDDVYFQPFSFDQWQRGTLTFQIDSTGIYQDMPALALAYTPSGAVTAPIVDVGNGLIDDYSGKDVRGKIALVYLGLLPGTPQGVRNMHRADKLSFAVAQGAAGCITINNSPNDVCITGIASLDGQLIKIPAVNVSYIQGMALKEQLKTRTCHAHIEMTNRFGSATARNVVGRIQGSVFPEETIVVGAHLDSWDIAPGALDNASGVVSVLEMARTFQALKLVPKRSIEFVLFMAEEEGHYGAETYVETAVHQNKIQNIRYMFNLDMTANTSAFNLMCRYDSEDFFKEVGALMQKVDSNFIAEPIHALYLGSDHSNFLFQGIPTFTPTGDLGPLRMIYHSPEDKVENITAQMLQSNVSLSSMILYVLSTAPTLPASRFTAEQVKQYLIENGLQEELVLSGDWIWD